MEFKQLAKIYLPVKDLRRSAVWYKKHFGLEVEKTSSDQNQVVLGFSQTSFVLIEAMPINRYSHIPFNFHTSDIESVRTRLLENGVTVTELKEDNGMLCCDFYDTDGNQIGIVQEERETQAQDFLEVGGIFLPVKSLKESVSWYKAIFDFDFFYFEAADAAGYAGSSPNNVDSPTIYYAGIKNGRFQPRESRIALVKTPEFYPLVYTPFSLKVSDAKNAYQLLSKKGVRLSDFYETEWGEGFCFYDCNGHKIGIESCGANNPKVKV